MSTLPEFELRRDTFGQWVFTQPGQVPLTGVQAVCAFPLSAPREAVSIVGPDGQECAFIERLDALDAVRRAAVEQALGERNFMPCIQRIRAVSTFATPSTWQVDTDHGPVDLVLKVEEDIRRLPGGRRLLITSAHGLVFDIPDTSRLDRHSRRLLERFL